MTNDDYNLATCLRAAHPADVHEGKAGIIHLLHLRPNGVAAQLVQQITAELVEADRPKSIVKMHVADLMKQLDPLAAAPNIHDRGEA